MAQLQEMFNYYPQITPKIKAPPIHHIGGAIYSTN